MHIFRKKSKQDPAKLPRNRWIALAIVLLASFMDLLDVTIVNVAVPSIQHQLGANYAAVQWVLAGYTLAFAVLLITGGRLGDIFGRKRLFMLGVGGFTLASLLCGIAGTPEYLIAARILQGTFAALMIPQVMASLVVLFPSTKERLSASGMYGAIAGLATVGGPIIGGLLIQGNPFDLEWRSIFLVNIPVGIFALAAAATFLPESKSPHPLKLDWIGMGLVTTALFGLLFPVIQGRDLDWPAWGFVMMGVAIVLLGFFIWYEARKTRKDGSPLMVLELFKSRAFVGGLGLFLVFMGALSGYFLFVTLFMQLGLGYSALLAGAAGVPFSIGVGVATGRLTPCLIPKIGRKILHIGAALLVVAMLSIAGLLHIFGTDITAWHLMVSFLIGGLGMGMVIAPLFTFVLGGVPHRDAGSASGVLNTIQQIGSAFGIAILGVVFFQLVATNAAPSAATSEDTLRGELTELGVPMPAQETVVKQFTTCFTDRAKAKDQSVEPVSCQTAKHQGSTLPAHIGQKIGDGVAAAAKKATIKNFVESFKQILLFEAALFVICFGLIFFLPKHAPEHPDIPTIA